MPDIKDFMTSKYLKKADLGERLQVLLTVKSAEPKNVAPEGQPQDRKLVLAFAETDKTLPLNKTNLIDTADALGSSNTDNWIGKKIVVFFDENVRFKGEKVGGVRVRRPKAGAVPEPVKPVPVIEDDPFDDEINF